MTKAHRSLTWVAFETQFIFMTCEKLRTSFNSELYRRWSVHCTIEMEEGPLTCIFLTLHVGCYEALFLLCISITIATTTSCITRRKLQPRELLVTRTFKALIYLFYKVSPTILWRCNSLEKKNWHIWKLYHDKQALVYIYVSSFSGHPCALFLVFFVGRWFCFIFLYLFLLKKIKN